MLEETLCSPPPRAKTTSPQQHQAPPPVQPASSTRPGPYKKVATPRSEDLENTYVKRSDAPEREEKLPTKYKEWKPPVDAQKYGRLKEDYYELREKLYEQQKKLNEQRKEVNLLKMNHQEELKKQIDSSNQLASEQRTEINMQKQAQKIARKASTEQDMKITRLSREYRALEKMNQNLVLQLESIDRSSQEERKRLVDRTRKDIAEPNIRYANEFGAVEKRARADEADKARMYHEHEAEPEKVQCQQQ
jgi:hypothetical protein